MKINEMLDEKITLDGLYELKEELVELLSSQYFPIAMYTIDLTTDLDVVDWKEILKAFNYKHQIVTEKSDSICIYSHNRVMTFSLEKESAQISFLRPMMNVGLKAKHITNGDVVMEIVTDFLVKGIDPKDLDKRIIKKLESITPKFKSTVFYYDWRNSSISDEYTTAITPVELQTFKYLDILNITKQEKSEELLETIKNSYLSLVSARFRDNIHFTYVPGGNAVLKLTYDGVMISLLSAFHKGNIDLGKDFITDFVDIYIDAFSRTSFALDPDMFKYMNYELFCGTMANAFLSIVYEINRLLGTTSNEVFIVEEELYLEHFKILNIHKWDKLFSHINSENLISNNSNEIIN